MHIFRPTKIALIGTYIKGETFAQLSPRLKGKPQAEHYRKNLNIYISPHESSLHQHCGQQYQEQRSEYLGITAHLTVKNLGCRGTVYEQGKFYIMCMKITTIQYIYY